MKEHGFRFQAIASVALAMTVYVSPTGVDTNPGTRDAPLRTLEAARDAVCRSRAGRPDRPRGVVTLLDGVYRRTQPLRLTARDSGVVWRAENRGKAVLNGSVRLDWRTPGAAEADRLVRLPSAARGKVRVATLPGEGPPPSFLRGSHLFTPSNDIPLAVFAAAGRLPCARWPNGRDALTEEVYDAHTFGVPAARAAAWAGEPDLWSFGQWCQDWIERNVPVKVVDATAGKVAYPREYACQFDCAMGLVRPFFVYNAFSELDRPGEWVLDRARRQLWLWPTDAAAEVALGGELVWAEGLADVTFDGLVFTRCRLPAIRLDDATRVAVVASTIRETGSWGVTVKGGADCRVEGCDLYELGEGGVRLEGGDLATLTPANHAVVNCHLHHLGRTSFNYRPAVELRGVGNRAEHNLIHHLRHAGVIFRGNDHYVGWNVLHDVTVSQDAGAIYSWQNSWVRRGGVIEHNLVHVSGRWPNPTMTMGIYLDDHTSDVTVRHNIVDYAAQGLHNGGGQSNRWYGNIVLNAATSYLVGQRGGGAELTAEITHAAAVCRQARWLRRYPDLYRFVARKERERTMSPGLVLTNNLFVSCGPEINLSHPVHARAMADSVVIADNPRMRTDPGFRDYAGFDWRAAPGSPFRARIDACRFERMGLFASGRRASPAVKFGPDLTPAFALGAPPQDMPRIDVKVALAPLDAARTCATDCRLCTILRWGDSRWVRAEASVDGAPGRPWHRYRFAFTPASDAVAEFAFGCVMRSLPVEFRDVRVEGAEGAPPAPGSFLGAKGAESKFAMNVRKGVPVTVFYEARLGASEAGGEASCQK